MASRLVVMIATKYKSIMANKDFFYRVVNIIQYVPT